jgi:hypothetical protein
MQPGPDDSDGPAPALPPEPAAAPAPGSSVRRAVLVAGLILGLCGLAVSVFGVASQILPRRFSLTQQRQIESWEVAGRWRALPEGQIFPADLRYTLPGAAFSESRGLRLTARRLGVARPARCAKGAGPDAGRILDRYGCTELLRATYLDSTGSMVVTVGVAVLRNAAAAAAADARLTGDRHDGQPDSVRPAPVSGTLAAHFSSSQRQLAWDTHAGPYVILATAGYADGRPRVRVAADSYLRSEMTSLDGGLGGAVQGVLGREPPLPSCPGAPGC